MKADACQEAKVALEVLRKDANDAAASLIVGKYRCFVCGEWEQGLPLLAKGGDADLKAAATAELKGAASANEQVKLGDAWWDLAEKRKARRKGIVKSRAILVWSIAPGVSRVDERQS